LRNVVREAVWVLEYLAEKRRKNCGAKTGRGPAGGPAAQTKSLDTFKILAASRRTRGQKGLLVRPEKVTVRIELTRIVPLSGGRPVKRKIGNRLASAEKEC